MTHDRTDSHYRFNKACHLCSNTCIRDTLAHGNTLYIHPLRITWLHHPQAGRTQVMVQARKRLFRHAVERNRLKRLMRETYRRRCHPLLDACTATGTHATIIISINRASQIGFTDIDSAMQQAINQLATHISQHATCPSCFEK